MCRRWVFMPMKVVVRPVRRRRAPATLKAGVMVGVRGRRFGVAVARWLVDVSLCLSKWFFLFFFLGVMYLFFNGTGSLGERTIEQACLGWNGCSCLCGMTCCGCRSFT